MQKAMKALKIVGLLTMLAVIIGVNGESLIQGWLRPVFALGVMAMFSTAVIYQGRFARRPNQSS